MKRGNCSTVPVSVINTTGHSLTLGPRVSLGHIESVKAVYPAAIQPVTPAQVSSVKVKPGETDCPDTDSRADWDPPVTLEHLAGDQQALAREMLKEECEAFAQDEYDVGCITSLRIVTAAV